MKKLSVVVLAVVMLAGCDNTKATTDSPSTSSTSSTSSGSEIYDAAVTVCSGLNAGMDEVDAFMLVADETAEFSEAMKDTLVKTIVGMCG